MDSTSNPSDDGTVSPGITVLSFRVTPSFSLWEIFGGRGQDRLVVRSPRDTYRAVFLHVVLQFHFEVEALETQMAVVRHLEVLCGF